MRHSRIGNIGVHQEIRRLERSSLTTIVSHLGAIEMNRKQVVMSFVAALVLFVAAIQAETIGNPLVSRDNIDNAHGAVFVDLDGFTQGARFVNTFSFFNNVVADDTLQVTPLIFHEVAGNYIISGVGSPVTNAGDGAQTFAFNLTSGSADVGPGYFFGYKNGTDANPSQTGVIEFSYSTPAVTSETYFGEGHSGDLSVGTNLGAGNFLDPTFGGGYRVYSLQATSVPEPASCILAGLGVLGLLMVARRRRKE
jgi:hypothetical protein